MRKKLLLCISLILAANTIKAQTVKESNLLDNWFIGIDGGAYIKTTNSDKFEDTRALLGIKAGRYITPVFGLRGDAQFYLHDTNAFASKTAFNMGNLSLDGLFNFNNLFAGYKGEPRKFEAVGVLGLGWCHGFGSNGNIDRLSTKIGMQLNYNFGSKKEWQINLEPDMIYLTDGKHGYNVWNINKSGVQVTAGITYKFKCSNKTHNFAVANICNQSDIDALNATINTQRDELTSKNSTISDNNREIENLKKQLKDCQDTKQEVSNTNLAPIVIFAQGKSVITAQQEANVHVIADYMKNNSNSKVVIKGYASSEGGKSFNQRLSLKRAHAVKNMLVNKYGIDADRLTVKGFGSAEQVFKENKWNRVCIFVEE